MALQQASHARAESARRSVLSCMNSPRPFLRVPPRHWSPPCAYANVHTYLDIHSWRARGPGASRRATQRAADGAQAGRQRHPQRRRRSGPLICRAGTRCRLVSRPWSSSQRPVTPRSTLLATLSTVPPCAVLRVHALAGPERRGKCTRHRRAPPHPAPLRPWFPRFPPRL